ncbi:four helix bundle protein [Leeuwenhoekiella parthenopeia]|uniref:Four helix bundle protein n=1 Tax=Leeuwenhoekiella parthenopeia TaxID=2890320 RepID=A0ABS8GP39_9FLAO|nr:four helix bundle protein [Leeuwenhoekiella parthenopeia]MCC4211761.1 four helix bundle protein [Leeuwenhoekiella parthenopeia]
MSDIKSFEDLNCWKMARELRNDISRLLKTFPDHEKFELIAQMRRASRSVTHNIAEGYGRFHHKENIQFCRTSRGSLHELLDQFITAFDEGYIDQEVLDKYKKQVYDCLAVLNGYINYLKRASN